MERREGFAVETPVAYAKPTARDRIYLARAIELARRGIGGVSPNPPVGAVVVTRGRTLGEGFHRMRGEPHAEIEALRDAAARGEDVRGATMIVSLEPCDHTGLTPPCTTALIEAGIARVVIGAIDPNPRTAGGGIARLLAAGIDATVVDVPRVREMLEPFAAVIRRMRPFVHLKLAVTLDGYIAPAPDVSLWLTGPEAGAYVHELRARYDAMLVGAATVRIDDPRLTVRPPHGRRRPYVRVVFCERAGVPSWRRIFVPLDGEHERATYARTIVVAPRGRAEYFVELTDVADVALIGAEDDERLDLPAAFEELARRGIASVLCEGGPHLAASLLAAGLVDRLDWIVVPRLLANPDAVPALTRADVSAGGRPFAFDRTVQLGRDVLISARFEEAHV